MDVCQLRHKIRAMDSLQGPKTNPEKEKKTFPIYKKEHLNLLMHKK